MIICFSCSAETKHQIDSLIADGGYAGISEVVASAIANLAVLQGELSSQGGALFLGGSESGMSGSLESSGRANPRPRRKTPAAADAARDAGHVSALFVRAAIEPSEAVVAPPTSDMWAPGHPIPADRWIFGQHNRLLPVKASCRALANLLGKEGRPIRLSEAAATIANEAVALGSYLEGLDTRRKASRGEALSTAFPYDSREPEGTSEKALRRFETQFVGAINRAGQVTGLPADLRLLNKVNGKGDLIALTQAGWEFAALPNPVIDTAHYDGAKRLSDEEIDFLLGYVRLSVPVERAAYLTVLEALENGSDTTQTLDAAVAAAVNPKRLREFSDSFIPTQRSGAISRMVDLGLVRRHRSGVRVQYVITGRGKKYLSQLLNSDQEA